MVFLEPATIEKTDEQLTRQFSEAQAASGASTLSRSNMVTNAGSWLQSAMEEQKKRDKEAAFDAAMDAIQDTIDGLQSQIDQAQNRIDARNVEISALDSLIEDIESGASAESINGNPSHRESLEKLRRQNGVSGDSSITEILLAAKESRTYLSNENAIDAEGIRNLADAKSEVESLPSSAGKQDFADIYERHNLSPTGKFEMSSNADNMDVSFKAAGISEEGANGVASRYAVNPSLSETQYNGLSVSQDISQGLSSKAITPDFMQASLGQPSPEPQFMQPNPSSDPISVPSSEI